MTTTPTPTTVTTKLPAAYSWLLGVDGLPRMLVEGLSLYGVHEAPGDADNPVILAWAAEVGLSRTYREDLTPWCGLYLAVVAKRADKSVPAQPLWALNWKQWGVESPRASLGDVLVFMRPGGGHVGLYVGEDVTSYHVLGGNTSDAVSIARLARGRVVAVRRPQYKIQPAGVIAVKLGITGAPLSTNEA